MDFKKRNGVDGYYGPDIPSSESTNKPQLNGCNYCGATFSADVQHGCLLSDMRPDLRVQVQALIAKETEKAREETWISALAALPHNRMPICGRLQSPKKDCSCQSHNAWVAIQRARSGELTKDESTGGKS